MPKQCCVETWGKIPADEPVFVLRGKDLLAPRIVAEWIQAAMRNGVNANKVQRAREHLEDMHHFQEKHPGRCKIPD